MVDIQTLLVTMLELFSFIILGWGVTKIGICDAHGNKVISSLVSNVLSPALILSAVQADGSSSTDKSVVWEALLYGVLLYAIFLVLGWVFTVWMAKEDRAVYKMLLIFSNTAFVGYPILRALFGEFSVFVFSIMHMPFNVLIFSYGVYLLQKDHGAGKFPLRKMVTPGLLSSIIAIILYFSNMKLPMPVVDYLSTLGDSSIPLSMIAVGASVALQPLGDMFKNKNLAIMTAVKLVAFPCLLAAISSFFPCSEFTRQLFILSGTLPAGTMTVILATQYNSNTKVASAGVVLSTLCSIITIPLLCQLLL